MPFGSEFHLSRLRQSLYLPSGIGMAFSRTPFGSEFHLSRLRQSLNLPSGIGMAFSITPFGSEFHLSRLRQSLYLPSGIGMAFSSNLVAAATSARVYEVLSAPRCLSTNFSEAVSLQFRQSFATWRADACPSLIVASVPSWFL